MYRKIQPARLALVIAGVFAVFAVVVWRLFTISFQRHDVYAQTAAAQASNTSSILVRGNIMLSDGDGTPFVVATNRRVPVLTVVPSKVTMDAGQLATQLSVAASADRDTILKAIDAGGTSSRVVAHNLTDAQVTAVSALHAAGVAVGYETDRVYPAGTLAADVIGFLGYGDNGREGQYGIEAAYDPELSGNERSGGLDLLGHLGTLVGASSANDPTTRRPEDVQLTIDRTIQAYVEQRLAAVIAQYHAASGTVVVQDPMTGKILALADLPTFDPNAYGSTPVGNFMDGALEPFEPGSSFKPVTMATGLEVGAVKPTTTFNDVGDVVIDGYTIKNFNEGHFGLVTMTQVLEKSINTGAMYAEQLIGNDKFLDGVVAAGFGQATGVDLPGESAGNIDNLYTGRQINFLTAAFGQGITATPLQMVNFYSAVANGGKLMKPYVVASIIDDHGNRTDTQPTVIGTPFSAATAATLRSMLVSVVDIGFDKARIPHYDVAGKTGTAQIASPQGGYLEGQYNHSFAGFAPASNPKFTIFIRMEKPQGITYAADSLSPVFKDIAMFLLNYLNVPPTR
ncbi:MAG TPA: penicillin-binding protein 2 [Candidatus Paceibacterota bacterium]|nr:penicillin-binding protein 2 [Candidatus Paceibacterota bacterium]